MANTYHVETSEKLESNHPTLKHSKESFQPSSFKVKPTDWLTVEELIAYLPMPCSKSTIYRWVKEGRIPYSKPSRHLIFKISQINQWLNGEKVSHAEGNRKNTNPTSLLK